LHVFVLQPNKSLQQVKASKDLPGNITHKKSGSGRFCSACTGWTAVSLALSQPIGELYSMLQYTYYECELVYIILSVIQFQII